jgi:hypothetical protein
MKKIILGLSGIFVAGFVIIMVANAQNNPQEVKKAATEVSKDCPKGPSASCCAKMSESKSSEAKVCDPDKCKEKGCDPAKCREGKCDPAKCKGATGEAMKCDPSACNGAAKKP